MREKILIIKSESYKTGMSTFTHLLLML